LGEPVPRGRNKKGESMTKYYIIPFFGGPLDGQSETISEHLYEKWVRLDEHNGKYIYTKETKKYRWHQDKIYKT
jgi:hypothetical protein